ncbi:hypothetical protein BDV96DRAFT_647960 [Lophiotrema nucula]|uniref:Uncharacterized protein n=1 Tax=Lophiotrema nucula TaxID=690887 RepID=A0A6A5Z2P5_9PLEO|nr:hypothetical protein BDV96DRAFT_647960 [Lophiotrema nucula]
MASPSNASGVALPNTHAITNLGEPTMQPEHHHEAEIDSNRSHKLYDVEKRLFGVCEIVETCRKEVYSVRSELSASEQTYKGAYGDMKHRYDQCAGAYRQLWIQHDKALKELSATTNNNWTLKRDLHDAQLRIIALEEKVQESEKAVSNFEEHLKLKAISEDSAELGYHLEQDSEKTESMTAVHETERQRNDPHPASPKVKNRKKRRGAITSPSDIVGRLRKERKRYG